MNLDQFLNITQVIISVLLIITILLQQREGGLGTTFGGSSGGEGFRTRRGLEKVLTNGTVVLAVLFVLNAIAIAAV
ncbi:MAG TPA: preprotein translocase subunit SecG [Candidatus Dojkabacteria bacterium]|jgi:protein translocase SecG subunit